MANDILGKVESIGTIALIGAAAYFAYELFVKPKLAAQNQPEPVTTQTYTTPAGNGTITYQPSPVSLPLGTGDTTTIQPANAPAVTLPSLNLGNALTLPFTALQTIEANFANLQKYVSQQGINLAQQTGAALNPPKPQTAANSAVNINSGQIQQYLNGINPTVGVLLNSNLIGSGNYGTTTSKSSVTTPKPSSSGTNLPPGTVLYSGQIRGAAPGGYASGLKSSVFAT